MIPSLAEPQEQAVGLCTPSLPTCPEPKEMALQAHTSTFYTFYSCPSVLHPLAGCKISPQQTENKQVFSNTAIKKSQYIRKVGQK